MAHETDMSDPEVNEFYLLEETSYGHHREVGNFGTRRAADAEFDKKKDRLLENSLALRLVQVVREAGHDSS